jgi:hypothetical protein
MQLTSRWLKTKLSKIHMHVTLDSGESIFVFVSLHNIKF